MTAADPLIGRRLGELEVKEKIGEGGFGTVYRALQRVLGHDGAVPQRFLREARLASRLDHPYAAHIYAFGVEPDGVRWIAMELVRGTPLSRLIKAQAHEQGMVHRISSRPTSWSSRAVGGSRSSSSISAWRRRWAAPRPPACRPSRRRS